MYVSPYRSATSLELLGTVMNGFRREGQWSGHHNHLTSSPLEFALLKALACADTRRRIADCHAVRPNVERQGQYLGTL
jgi:hypothetical protein